MYVFFYFFKVSAIWSKKCHSVQNDSLKTSNYEFFHNVSSSYCLVEFYQMFQI